MRRCLTPLSLIAVAAIVPFCRAQSPTPAVPAPPTAQAQPMPPAAPPPAPDTTSPFAPLTSAALGDSFVAMTAPGYLDPAAPMNVFRFRYDSEHDINRPDRSEFFYAKSGLLGGRGVDELQSTLDMQVLTAYVEVAPTSRFSVFADIPYRVVTEASDSDVDRGLSDVDFGMKTALILQPDQILSLQLKAYAPSGNASLGLGNGHWTFEPSLLAWKKLGEKTQIYAQLGDWIPLTDSDFAGNVLEYGVGVSYTAFERGCFRISPVVEMLGWSVLSGKEFTGLETPVPMVVDAAGTTIVNAKVGVRLEAGAQSLYVGYGRALTSDIWYRDIFRVEYRLQF
jgi:outer membrane putative beta-barrel porin/alpha-amylase